MKKYRFSVRPATLLDRKALYEMLCEREAKIPYNLAQDKVFEIIADPSQGLFVAIARKNLLGYLHIRLVNNIYEEDFSEIADFFVRKNQRRKGVGGLLLKTAEQWCVQSLYKEIRFLRVNECPLIRDYLQKSGYSENSAGDFTKTIYNGKE